MNEVSINIELNTTSATQQAGDETVDHIDGWVIAENPETKESYYANIYTNETSTTKPQAILDWEAKQKTQKENVKQGEGYEERKAGDNGFKRMTSVLDDVKSFSAVDKYMAVGRQATEYTFENTPFSSDADFDFNELPAEFMEKVKEADFWEWAREYVNPRKKLFGGKIPVETVLAHTTSSLDKPLTKLKSVFNEICGQTFKNIQSYTGDRSSSKPPIGHAKKLIEMGMEQSMEMRDEIFLQLIKQTRENPNPDKLLRAWKLFGVISSVFYPGDTLYYPCLNYLWNVAINDKEEEIQRYARFCFKRVQKIFEGDIRLKAPCNEEIQFVEGRKQIMVPIYFLTGNHTYVPIESYSTALDVKHALLNKLQFNKFKQDFIYLYEICENKDQIEERFVENDEKIADLISMWDEEIREKQTEKMTFKLYMKIRFYYTSKIESLDVDDSVMFFSQTVYDIVNDRIPVTEEQLLHLVALQLHVDWGSFSEGTVSKFMENIDQYIPRKMLGDHSPDDWVELIKPYAAKISDYDKQRARNEYLNFCKQFPLFLGQQYPATYQQREEEPTTEYPENVIVAITPEHLIIADGITREVVKAVKLHNIITWGVSTEFFVPVIGDRLEQEKLYFATTQAKNINFLLQTYTALKLGEGLPASVVKVSRSTREGAPLAKGNARNAVVFPKTTYTVSMNPSATS